MPFPDPGGCLRWRSLGSDGLLGETDDLQVVINRSREQPLPLSDHIRSGTVIWSSKALNSIPDALGCQSAVVVMAGVKALDET